MRREDIPANWTAPHVGARAVYKILVDDELFYVGSTRNPLRRFEYHKVTRRIPRDAEMKVVGWHADDKAGFKAERELISELKPPANGMAKRAAIEWVEHREYEAAWAPFRQAVAEIEANLATPEGQQWMKQQPWYKG